ncbi:MAG: prenyltransferase/squalene oxidase repeat-containing protein [Candidatus Bathyarchaeia archaeon]
MKTKIVLDVEKRLFRDSPWVKSITDYVINRQNADGGYAFVRTTASNAQDTYYGLAILDLLKFSFPNVKQTVKWLHEFVPDNLYSHYYVAKALKLCDKNPHQTLSAFLRSIIGSQRISGTMDVYAEVDSEFEATFMVTELTNMIGVKVDREKTINWLLSFQNKDGGFGAHRHSNLNSTYHAVASLFNVGYPVKSLKTPLAYVRSCEKPSGGFTVIPRSSSPFMEHVYYGISTLDLLGERAAYPEETAKFVFKCQNANGGFARSDLGISTFEDTFYAVSILRKIGKL